MGHILQSGQAGKFTWRENLGIGDRQSFTITAIIHVHGMGTDATTHGAGHALHRDFPHSFRDFFLGVLINNAQHYDVVGVTDDHVGPVLGTIEAGGDIGNGLRGEEHTEQGPAPFVEDLDNRLVKHFGPFINEYIDGFGGLIVVNIPCGRSQIRQNNGPDGLTYSGIREGIYSGPQI